jgi:hypothetical protein
MHSTKIIRAFKSQSAEQRSAQRRRKRVANNLKVEKLSDTKAAGILAGLRQARSGGMMKTFQWKVQDS